MTTEIVAVTDAACADIKLISDQPRAVFVCPDASLVDSLLAMNTKNRHVRKSVVAGYVRAIRSGNWRPTNQGVGVSRTGFLVDGQHRLLAIREAGFPPLSILLVTGLDDDVIGCVDAGTNRTAGDYLRLLFDQSLNNQVTSLLRVSMLAEIGFNSIVKFQPSEYAKRFDLLKVAIQDIHEAHTDAKRLPGPVQAALVDAHDLGFDQDAMYFAREVCSGSMLAEDSPALALRNWLMASRRGGGGNPLMIERYGKTTRALKAWIEGKPLAKLYFSRQRITLASILKGRE